MSLKDILDIERNRVNRERVVLDTIYERLKNRINNSVKVKAKECVYTIPEFIPGYPLINVTKTMNYILNKLTKEGFIAIQLTFKDLYVTWDPLKIREMNEKLKTIESTKKEKDLSMIYNDKPNLMIKTARPIDKKIIEKEFERANEDFINSLVISKKKSK